ncbi:MAG: ABC transporter ATP-binding protein [Chloroflexi bacterium]|nr:ABC transporter ATP-binding protein [Chloroflexota bacterium]
MKNLIRAAAFLRPYAPQVIASLLTLLILTGLNLLIPRIIQAVIDDGLLRRDSAYLIRSALLLFGLGVVSALLGLINRYASEWVAAHVGYDLRNRMYDHIQYLPFAYHDHAQSGQLISRCIEDVRAIEKFAGSSIPELARFLLLLTGILAVMFSANAQLALVALLPMIPLIWMTANFHKWVRVIDEWAKIMPTTNWLIAIGTMLILFFGGNMVMEGTITVGAVVAFNAYLLMMGEPAQALTGLVNAGGEAAAGAQRVFEVLDTEPDIKSGKEAAVLSVLKGEVEFENVSLKYQDEKIRSLTGIDLKVAQNKIVALIGPTGSGKTSLVNLIPRFYDATSGVVRVDGHDVRGVELTSLRKQIGIVLQTSLLFSDTIRANLAYGRPEATEEEIIAAAKAAQAHEFIIGFTKGYDTIVGERGVTLSGGQRQRVAIARALLMNPRILILDDSLSSVDTQTEKLIQSALDVLMEGRTTFVIAHRLSTVRRADMILVMDKGRIVERGTHAELLAAGGLYKEIHDLQLIQREEAPPDARPLPGEKPINENAIYASKSDSG